MDEIILTDISVLWRCCYTPGSCWWSDRCQWRLGLPRLSSQERSPSLSTGRPALTVGVKTCVYMIWWQQLVWIINLSNFIPGRGLLCWPDLWGWKHLWSGGNSLCRGWQGLHPGSCCWPGIKIGVSVISFDSCQGAVKRPPSLTGGITSQCLVISVLWALQEFTEIFLIELPWL